MPQSWPIICSFEAFDHFKRFGLCKTSASAPFIVKYLSTAPPAIGWHRQRSLIAPPLVWVNDNGEAGRFALLKLGRVGNGPDNMSQASLRLHPGDTHRACEQRDGLPGVGRASEDGFGDGSSIVAQIHLPGNDIGGIACQRWPGQRSHCLKCQRSGAAAAGPRKLANCQDRAAATTTAPAPPAIKKRRRLIVGITNTLRVALPDRGRRSDRCAGQPYRFWPGRW